MFDLISFLLQSDHSILKIWYNYCILGELGLSFSLNIRNALLVFSLNITSFLELVKKEVMFINTTFAAIDIVIDSILMIHHEFDLFHGLTNQLINNLSNPSLEWEPV
jgi:hypothetical protein